MTPKIGCVRKNVASDARPVALQQPEVRHEVEAGDHDALEADGAGESPRPAGGLGLEERGDDQERRACP